METAAEILRKSFDSKFPTNSKTSSSGSNGTPSRPTGGKPDCPHCNGMGFVIPAVPMEHPDFGRAVMCTCRLAEEETKKSKTLYKISQLGALQECTFENFFTDGINLNHLQRLNLKLAYEKTLKFAKNPEGWLVLHGSYGCGKTHLAAAIANTCIKRGQLVLFINTPDLLDHLRAAYGPTSSITYDERFEQVRNAPLLILDDLGTQNSTDWALEKLYQIFNYRYNARLPTVVTSNEDLESLEPRIGSRMADHTLVEVVAITASDFRQAGLDKTRSDLSTLSLHSDKTFENFDFRELELPARQTENLRRAFDTAKEFAENPTDWLVLNSTSYGNGKTHLAAAIANKVNEHGIPVLFIFVPDLLDHLRATFNPSSNIRYDKRFDEIKTAPFLVLDDLGTESATAWAREKLYQLFNYRYNDRKPTIITTAVPIDEIDPRLASRMFDSGRCTFFVLEVPGYRGGTKAKRPRQRRK